jgi:phytoene dehydrogenase-like protein
VPGGPHALATAFADAAKRSGAAIRTNAAVARIDVREYAVTGVVLDTGEEIRARTVLSSADPSKTMLGLIDAIWLDPEFTNAIGNIRYRGCTSFVLYALDGMPDVPGLPDPASALAGIVSLTPTMDALERAYDATKYGEVGERPHIEVGIQGWPDAERRVTLVARVQYEAEAEAEAESGAGAGAEAGAVAGAVGGLAERITRAIGCVVPGFGERVLHRVEVSPRDIEERWGYTEGAVSQGEMALDQILFMRPVAGWSRHAMPVDGLYVCGAGTHPGPGVAGGPGWLAAREVLRPGRR